LEKLRGVRIESASYPFTLAGAQFRSLPLSPREIPVVLPRWDPDPAPQADSIWPGSIAYARAFGRLPLGGLTVLEIDPEVHTDAFRVLTAPAVGHVLESGGRVLYLAPPGGLPRARWEGWRRNFSPAFLAERLRYIPSDPNEAVPPDFEASVFRSPREPAPAGAQEEPPDMARFRAGADGASGPLLSVASLGGLRALTRIAMAGSGREVPALLDPLYFSSLVSRRMADTRGHIVVFANSTDPLLASLVDLARTRIRLRDRHGRMLLHGVRPATAAYYLDLDAGTPGPYGLVPVV
jgi:hypothetical protein